MSRTISCPQTSKVNNSKDYIYDGGFWLSVERIVEEIG